MSVSFYRPPPRTGGSAPVNALQASGEDRVIATSNSVTLTVGVGAGLVVNQSGNTILGLPTRTVQTGPSAVNISQQDTIVLVDAQTSGGSVNLPDASTLSSGRHFIVKCTGYSGSNAVTLGTRGGDIDGGNTLQITESHAAVCVVTDGSDYWIV